MDDAVDLFGEAFAYAGLPLLLRLRRTGQRDTEDGVDAARFGRGALRCRWYSPRDLVIVSPQMNRNELLKLAKHVLTQPAAYV